jgi:hypothetical protein
MLETELHQHKILVFQTYVQKAVTIATGTISLVFDAIKKRFRQNLQNIKEPVT